MNRWVLTLALVSAVMLATATGASSATLARDSYSTTIDRASAWHGASDRMPATGSSLYLELAGDAGTGPDIGPIIVSNDDDAVLTFNVPILNRTSPRPDFALIVFINSDLSAATGDPRDGSDYLLVALQTSAALIRWTGPNSTSTTQAL